MSRKSTGTVRLLQGEHGPQWHAKWTRADGTRTEWLPLNPKVAVDEPSARAEAARLAPKVRHASAEAGSVETFEAYAKRWCTWREGRGVGCVTEDRSLLRRHVFDVLGPLDVRAVGRDDLKRLVTALDDKARRGETLEPDGTRRPFGWKRAVNAWIVVRALFRDARGAKDVTLCVRDDNPIDGVAGPDVGASKAKQYLYPSEFLALVSCPDVPLRWRRLFTLAVYSQGRAGELDALEWSDIDLEHQVLHIHRSIDDRRGRGTKATKSDAARRVPLEPALLPLLKAMHEEGGGEGPVLRLPGDGAAEKLRGCLKRAGVDRADLHVTDATRKAMTFHDLRATGITWCAVRGDDPLKIKQRAGHESFSTTEIYIREAEAVREGFGTVFPPLPEELLRIAPESPRTIRRSRSSGKTSRTTWPLRELNPDALAGYGF
jgi:integrase